MLPEPDADEDKIDYNHKPCDHTEKSQAAHHPPATIIIHHINIITPLVVKPIIVVPTPESAYS